MLSWRGRGTKIETRLYAACTCLWACAHSMHPYTFSKKLCCLNCVGMYLVLLVLFVYFLVLPSLLTSSKFLVVFILVYLIYSWYYIYSSMAKVSHYQQITQVHTVNQERIMRKEKRGRSGTRPRTWLNFKFLPMLVVLLILPHTV